MIATVIAAVRDLLDRLPTPIKVALWLAASGAVTAVGQGVTDGQIVLDAVSLAVTNIVLVLLRSQLDRRAPALTGASARP